MRQKNIMKNVTRTVDAPSSVFGTSKSIWWLYCVVLTESFIFPIPPDPLYVAILLHQRQCIWRLALTCTLLSVVGGVVGYMMGYMFYASIGSSIIQAYGYAEKFNHFANLFRQWGAWIILAKGLTPIPYKIVTIASGVVGVSMWTFLLSSTISRGLRFFILALLIWWWGEKAFFYMKKYRRILYLMLAIGVIGGFCALALF